MTKVITDENKIKEIINSRYIENTYPGFDFLEERLKSGDQLAIYIGFDPTAPDLHLGHSTNFLVLRKFQDLGHKVVIVIGDFTAQIGDPTGKNISRRPLSEKEVSENSKTYKNQVGKILSISKTDFKNNSRWLSKLNLKEVIELLSTKSVQQLLHRDMFQRRMKENKNISLHEFVYPLLQGYDSVALKTDGEMGGNDQTFNMIVGRDLERIYLKKEKFVIATKLLINPATGKKLMSKSEGSYVSLRDQPNEMYAKVMALPDEVVFTCFELCTEVPMERINNLKSGDILVAKRELALEITRMYHGEKEAEKAKNEWGRVFSKKELPSEIEELEIKGDSMPLGMFIVGWMKVSNSEAKRLISEQNAVRVNDVLVTDWNYKVKIGDIVQVGPRKFVKVRK